MLISNKEYLKKKYFYVKKINKCIFKLRSVLSEKQKFKHSNVMLLKDLKKLRYKKQLKGMLLVYIIHFSFSPANTFLQVTDTAGNLKFCCSAGLVNFKGKQKKSRIVVLGKFFNKLRQLKISFLRNKPVVVHLKNVGFYRYFIIRNLKKYFFIKMVKNYEFYPYNGCRKIKKLKKKQRSKRS